MRRAFFSIYHYFTCSYAILKIWVEFHTLPLVLLLLIPLFFFVYTLDGDSPLLTPICSVLCLTVTSPSRPMIIASISPSRSFLTIALQWLSLPCSVYPVLFTSSAGEIWNIWISDDWNVSITFRSINSPSDHYFWLTLLCVFFRIQYLFAPFPVRDEKYAFYDSSFAGSHASCFGRVQRLCSLRIRPDCSGFGYFNWLFGQFVRACLPPLESISSVQFAYKLTDV